MATMAVRIEPDVSGARVVRRSLDDIKNAARDTENATDRFGRSANDNFNKAARGANVADRAMKTLGRSALAMGAAMAAAFSFQAVFRTLAGFESSMAQVAAITRATGDELKAMRDVAKELGSTTEFSASQAADGLKFLGMAGFSAAESVQAIPAVLNLATAAAMDLGSAADITSNIMSGFGIAASNAGDVADVLAAASSRANTDVQQLGGAMSTVAPIAAALNIGLADTAAAIGVLSDAGIQGERAGTALRGVLASLAGPTTQAKEVIEGLGLTLSEVNPATNDLSTIFGRLRDAGMSTADAMKIFGREAASGALVLTDAADRVGEFGEELAGASGEAERMAAIMRDQLGGDFNSLVSSVEGLIIAMGEAGLTAVLRSMLQTATTVFRTLTDNMERLVTYIKTAAVIAMVAFRGAIWAAATAAWGFVTALVATRAALVRTGIGVAIVLAGELVYQFMQLIDRTGSFGGALVSLGSTGVAIWEALKLGGQGLGDILQAVAKRAEGAFLTAWANILQGFANMIKGIADTLKGGMFDSVSAGLYDVAASIAVDGVKQASDAAATAFSDASAKEAEGVEKITTAFNQATEAATALAEGSKGASKGIGEIGDQGPTVKDIKKLIDETNQGLGETGDAASTAASGISEAERALEEFISTADRLAEDMFPGEYARREAEDLAASLATYGDALDDFQRQAVEARIADQYEAAKLGVRELEDETKDASKEMGDSLWDNFGSILADLFSGPIEDADEFFEKIMSGFAQIGQQNLSRGLDSLFGGGSGAPAAANDNGGGNWLDSLFGGVKDGAREGTAEGSASGIMGALGSGGASNTLGTLAGAAAGGYGMGYQTQSPMMGAAGGALQGFMAGGGFTPMGLLGGAIGGIMGFLGGMQGAAKALKEAQEKLDSLRNEIDQFVAAANGEVISQYASALDDARQKAKEYIELAKKAEDFDLVADIEEAMVNLPQTLAREFQKDLTASINSLRGLDYLNEVVSAQDQYNERLADAEKFGMDTADAFLELRLSMQEMADGSNVAQAELDSLAQRFPKLADALANIIPTGALEADLETAMDALNDRQSDLRAAYNDQSSTLGSLISQLERAQRSIREFRASLMIDDLTPLGQRDQVEAARQQFEDVAARVANGDVDALEELTGVSRDYLNEARDYYASSEAYAQIWEEVNRTLAEAESIAGRQLTEAQQQQAALDRQVGLLIDINDSVMSVSDAVAALAVAQQAASKAQSAAVDSIYEKALGRTPDQGGRDFYEDLLGSGSSVGDIAGQIVNSREGKIAQMYRDIFGRNPDAAGLDYYMGSGQSLDTIRQHLEFAKANGAFQSGGFTGMGGVSDIAGVVHGQEYVMNAPSTRSIGPSNLDYMNRTGRMPGNDNSDVVAELRALRQELTELKTEQRRTALVTGEAGKSSAAASKETNERLADIQSDLRKKAS